MGGCGGAPRRAVHDEAGGALACLLLPLLLEQVVVAIQPALAVPHSLPLLLHVLTKSGFTCTTPLLCTFGLTPALHLVVCLHPAGG